MARSSTTQLAKIRAEQSRDRSKRATNSIATGHARRTMVEAEMVVIHSTALLPTSEACAARLS